MTEFKPKVVPRHGTAHILLVEDLPDDAFLFQRAVRRAGLDHTVCHLSSAAEAIKYLSRQAPYDDALYYPPVDVVVLDLKMPGIDGFEVLQWLRDRKGLRPAPVVVLTSSELTADRKRAEELGANEYYVKPPGFDQLVEVARSINDRWITRQE
jgi:CheY-like chemotaxis protein